MILDPLCLFAMDSALYASMHVLVDDKCNMPRVFENACMSDKSHDCDAMYMNPWMLLIFLTLNSSRKMLRSFKRI